MYERGYFAYIILLLLFTVGRLLNVTSQEYSYRHYTVEDGLVQNQVMNILQDSRGYIWLATKGGVSRFDGTDFKNFTVNDGLLSNYIMILFEDSQGGINFFSIIGISRLYHDKIETTLLRDTITETKDLLIIPNYAGSDILVLNANQMYCYSAPFDSVKFKMFKSLEGLNPINILPDKKENTFFIRNDLGEVYSLTENYLIQRFTYKDANFALSLSGKMLAYKDNVIFEPDTANQIHEIIKFGETISHFRTGFNADTSMFFVTGQKTLGILRDNHCSYFNKKFNYINRLLVDRDENLWICTETGFYRLITDAFENFNVETGINEYVWNMVEDKDRNIWFASYGDGLGIWDGKKFSRNIEYKNVYSTQGGNYFYTGAIMASDQNLYFPVREDGVLKYDGQSFSLIPGLPHGSCLDIFEDSLNHRFLIASTAGLVVINENQPPVLYEQNFRETRKFIKTIAQDKYGRYWLGGEYMLNIFNGKNFMEFPNEQYDYDAGAVCIFRDHLDNLWLGTTAGLYFYDYDIFRRIAPEKLKSQVSSIVELDSAKLIMGISEGLGEFDLELFYTKGDESVQIYDASRGFLGFDCIRNGILKDSENHIWLSTSERVVKYDPEKLKSDTVHPQINFGKIITSGRNGELMTLSVIPGNNDSLLLLPYFFRNIRFDYHAIHFTAPEKVTYACMLEGYDDDWLNQGGIRSSIYTNLGPGHYSFKVKARNIDGLWSNQPAVFNFEIKPAFWQTMAFRIGTNFLILILILLLGYLWMRNRRKRQLIREANERRISELQLKTIRSQMDPHFTFNALTSIGSVIYREDKEKAYNYFTKFSKLVRATLEVSDKIARNLSEEIEFTRNYLDLEKIRFQNDFEYIIDIGENVNQNCKIPKMSIQNYVENAVKHGLKHKSKNRKLWIIITQDSKKIKIIIEDNGVGRENASHSKQYSTGKGLNIMEAIYDLYFKLYKIKIEQNIEDLTNLDGKPSGTRVILYIPQINRKVVN